jgi:2,3-bisphosphoglycerate-dependent phosphoglycerate mutase
VLLRHGESEWNAKNLFTGWANPGLTAAGERDAVRAGHLLAEHGMLPDTVHTSLQRRAIHSADLALAACDRDWIAVHRSWRLNGRHYGAPQGKDKAQARAEFGEQRVQLWRRPCRACRTACR